jgi:hypothetical protein
MNKIDIKLMLNNAINEFISLNEAKSDELSEAAKKRKKLRKAKDSGKKEDPESDSGKKDYTDVQRAFEKDTGPTMAGVMRSIGIKDDKKGVNRSLFRKMVKQIKNPDTGSYYQFDDKKLARVRTKLKIS